MRNFLRSLPGKLLLFLCTLIAGGAVLACAAGIFALVENDVYSRPEEELAANAVQINAKRELYPVAVNVAEELAEQRELYMEGSEAAVQQADSSGEIVTETELETEDKRTKTGLRTEVSQTETESETGDKGTKTGLGTEVSQTETEFETEDKGTVAEPETKGGEAAGKNATDDAAGSRTASGDNNTEANESLDKNSEPLAVSDSDTNLRFLLVDVAGEIVAKSESLEDADTDDGIWQYEWYLIIAMEEKGGYVSVHTCDLDDVIKSNWDVKGSLNGDGEWENLYTVYAYVEDNEGGLTDHFTWILWLIHMMYVVRYLILAAAAIACLLTVVCFFGLMCVSGRKPRTEEVLPGSLNPAPFDLLAVISVALCCIATVGVVEVAERSYFGSGIMETLIVKAAIIGIYCLVVGSIALGLCMSIAARVKQKRLLRNTVCAGCILLLWRIIKAICGLLGRGCPKAGRILVNAGRGTGKLFGRIVTGLGRFLGNAGRLSRRIFTCLPRLLAKACREIGRLFSRIAVGFIRLLRGVGRMAGVLGGKLMAGGCSTGKMLWKLCGKIGAGSIWFFGIVRRKAWGLCKGTGRIFTGVGRGIGRLCGRVAEAIGRLICKIPLVRKTVMVYVILCFVELLVYLALYSHYRYSYYYVVQGCIVFFAVEKLLVGTGLIYVALNLRRLQKGGEKLAGGDLSYQIDTSRLFWDFKEHGENLNKIADGMAVAVEQRMKSERMKTELITNVSHDIKTPLTSIISYADLIGKEPCDNEKIKEYAGVLVRQSDRLKRLIEDLVEASKASTGNLEVVLMPCDSEIFLTQVSGEYERKLQECGLTLIVSEPDHPVYVMADGRRMQRIFDNLMNNICKYAQPGTRVYLSLAETGGQAVITLKNTSRAALNLSADELMERFVRGDSSRRTEGNGLGLSIARSLAELQGGKLELEIDGDLFKVTMRFPVIVAGNEAAGKK